MALAPMHDVTETVFRRLIARRGKPDVMFTEFVSTEGLAHPLSREKMIHRYLGFTPQERPLVAQIWGTNPDHFESAARLIVELGFDGVDINMGCPERSAVKYGACSALIESPELAKELIRATQRGTQGLIPVSVKTRLGYRENIIEEWVKHILETEPAVITVHGRTAKQMSGASADWESIGRAVEIACGSGTLILGNGDIQTLEEAYEKVRDYGVDGVMFGRAIFSNHWLFDRDRQESPSIEQRLQALIEHAKLFEEVYGVGRGFCTLRKHFRAYTSGFPGGKELRIKLMEAESSEDIWNIVSQWKGNT